MIKAPKYHIDGWYVDEEPDLTSNEEDYETIIEEEEN